MEVVADAVYAVCMGYCTANEMTYMCAVSKSVRAKTIVHVERAHEIAVDGAGYCRGREIGLLSDHARSLRRLDIADEWCARPHCVDRIRKVVIANAATLTEVTDIGQTWRAFSLMAEISACANLRRFVDTRVGTPVGGNLRSAEFGGCARLMRLFSRLDSVCLDILDDGQDDPAMVWFLEQVRPTSVTVDPGSMKHLFGRAGTLRRLELRESGQSPYTVSPSQLAKLPGSCSTLEVLRCTLHIADYIGDGSLSELALPTLTELSWRERPMFSIAGIRKMNLVEIGDRDFCRILETAPSLLELDVGGLCRPYRTVEEECRDLLRPIACARLESLRIRMLLTTFMVLPVIARLTSLTSLRLVLVAGRVRWRDARAVISRAAGD
jgi:hypothetical protein